MDVTDFVSSDKSKLIDSGSGGVGPPSRPKIFCCGETLNVKSLLSRPGQAVKIMTTTLSGTHAIDHEDEVGECKLSTISRLSPPHNKSLEKKVEFLSDNHLNEIDSASINGDYFETLNEQRMPSTSARSQNDLIKFVFTSHGIRVISDKEYVV